MCFMSSTVYALATQKYILDQALDLFFYFSYEILGI